MKSFTFAILAAVVSADYHGGRVIRYDRHEQLHHKEHHDDTQPHYHLEGEHHLQPVHHETYDEKEPEHHSSLKEYFIESVHEITDSHAIGQADHSEHQHHEDYEDYQHGVYYDEESLNHDHTS